MTPESSGPLTGIRILDFTTFQAGAQATTILADLGADVIKVENTTIGDEGRVVYRIGPRGKRESVFFYTCNRGKRSIALDLKRPEAIAVIDSLVKQVDVVANNFRSGVMERLNLSYERLRGLNPDLIYVSVTGWGKRGPKAAHPALDTAAQARGGLVAQTGDADGFPVPAGAAVADAYTATNLAIAMLAAILSRNRTGEGQEIDLSLFASALALQAPEINWGLLSGRPVPRAGRGHPLVPSLTRVFQTSDGFFAVIGVEDTRWPGFCRAIDRPDLQRDERFKSAQVRKRHMPELCAILDPIFLTRNTAEWIALLEAADQSCSPVQRYSDLPHDPVVLANDYIREIDHPRMGKGHVVASPFQFHGTPVPAPALEPRLGEHTREILALAGLDAAEIDSLLATAVARQAE